MNSFEKVNILTESEINSVFHQSRRCVESLLKHHNIDDFRAIIGIDCSGRLPAFTTWRLLKQKYGAKTPPLYFLLAFKPQYATRFYYTDFEHERIIMARLRELSRYIPVGPKKILFIDNTIANGSTLNAILLRINEFFPDGIIPVLMALRVYMPGISLDFRKRYDIHYPNGLHLPVSVKSVPANGVHKRDLNKGQIYPHLNYNLEEACRVRKKIIELTGSVGTIL